MASTSQGTTQRSTTTDSLTAGTDLTGFTIEVAMKMHPFATGLQSGEIDHLETSEGITTFYQTTQYDQASDTTYNLWVKDQSDSLCPR